MTAQQAMNHLYREAIGSGEYRHVGLIELQDAAADCVQHHLDEGYAVEHALESARQDLPHHALLKKEEGND